MTERHRPHPEANPSAASLRSVVALEAPRPISTATPHRYSGAGRHAADPDLSHGTTTVMECIVRVCASPARLRDFLDSAAETVRITFPSPVRTSIMVTKSSASLLRGWWLADNGSTASTEPETRTLFLAFADDTGWLTAARIESLCRKILSGLTPVGLPGVESVPYIVTVHTELDERARAAFALRHPSLDAG